MKDYKNVTIFEHPLIQHKIAILRNKDTGTKDFRELVEEITALMTFECLKDVPTRKVMVTTPLEKTEQTIVIENSVAVVPVLRAGLGMVNGVHRLFPTACKLPDGIEDKITIILDPMLATGGSACAAIELLKKRGCTDIRLMNIIAAPVGVETVAEKYPDVKVFIACLDRQLNEHGYILPGLGDAGDRLFGTK